MDIRQNLEKKHNTDYDFPAYKQIFFFGGGGLLRKIVSYKYMPYIKLMPPVVLKHGFCPIFAYKYRYKLDTTRHVSEYL